MTPMVWFPGTEKASLAEVGGKGYSLIEMVAAGFPVPPGAVLTTSFFAPWFHELQTSTTWSTLVDATQDKWASLCSQLQELCPALALTATQRHVLDDLRQKLAVLGDDVLLAVRSSSPEEDLASASFAGGYETRLGVRLAELEDALRHCVASSLDERVFIYKQEHGFEVLSPRIAVVIQQQIDSEVAGVGFSLNPLTNDYDEAVINANWGLGESVVAGLASPDHFIVDKVGRHIVDKKPGAKQVSIWLGDDGGTIEREGHRMGEITLSDAQILELTDVMCRIEAFYQRPVDIEWAYVDSQLHVLQARPITTHVPLPAELMTKPGEPRRLYQDIALAGGLTINAPISPMGLDWMEQGVVGLYGTFLGSSFTGKVAPEHSFWHFAGGRMYQNLSSMLWLMSPERMAKKNATSDALTAEILGNIDAATYRTATRPPWARWRMLWSVPGILWRLRGFFGNALWAILAPERARRAYQRKVDAYEAGFAKNSAETHEFAEFRRTGFAAVARQVFHVTMAAIMAYLAGVAVLNFMVRKKSAVEKALAEKLKVGFAGNVVVDMGIALFRLAKLLDRSDFEDLDRLAERVEKRQLPEAFLNAWDAFLAAFGCRGPLEMDLANPRYADDPRLALGQMALMAVDDADFDPEAAHQRHIAARWRAYGELCNRWGWLRRALLGRVHRIIDLFAGTRDTPKHHLLLFFYTMRQRALQEGRRLVDQGRLDAAEDIFDLTFRDLDAAAAYPSLDLREVRAQRTGFGKILAAQVMAFPHVIDSRGRILRPPPRREKPGELSGMAVSPGVVTGPVKVLRTPHEKPINKGDVLVAHTTDPGWTPLFVNAAAVVIEVGGVLQHGAVVAREYGKPCVAGIDAVTTKLHDHQRVEVDGTAGVVRILS